mmetsp:Transcript_85636/g.250735  ORF Transcript_85636/g.250735 Transcript_85636/m.250735 type:complete len:214 (-) Transcript_85636:961-1602(-)
MVTIVSHMACGSEPMLSRGSTRKISAEKTSVSMASEKRQIGRASTQSSKDMISNLNLSNRLIVLMSRSTGTKTSIMFCPKSSRLSPVLSGIWKFRAARIARGATATMSIRLHQLFKKVNWLGQTRNRRSSSSANMASTATSVRSAASWLKIGGSMVCRMAMPTESMMKTEMPKWYQLAALLDSGSSRKLHIFARQLRLSCLSKDPGLKPGCSR